ncbi:MAG: S8 family serine peptidase [Bacteroidetes bacterium]|nr:S8 family serine peptidase [Bacteroidota bacterium]
MKTSLLFLSVTTLLLFSLFLNDDTNSRNDLSGYLNDKDYIEGDLIVMFNSPVNAQEFADNYSDIGMIVKEELVKDMNIYLFQYDVSRSQPVDALMSVMRNDKVAIAQFNHRFKERVMPPLFPNDTRFSEQWDKNNTGQTGGTPDADIDAPEAWEVTTGGVTSLGDTIVVAIVDGGQQTNHQDLDTWVNYAEIPGNGIDDDNNGYVDDIYGWNAGSNNGTIPANQHGTHCAGIAGAMGNNSLGVAGVNWKVKTMPVVYGSATEANAVKAYGYVFKQRKLYNQSNGTMGAYVVSTNSSWGIDNGQPSNYPLWCAFYDTLGSAGILSCGAGPNNNVNIDVVGDMPTTCPSDFLIAVTNTTNTDAKNSGAGYGPINMDLGAPGTSILSTIPTNSYGLLTGTSMATPQVAGAVALMHAAAGSVYIQLGRTRPDSLARLFKQYILSTVDTLPSLNGITVSNGRLNVAKLVNKVKITNVPVLNSFNLQSPAAGQTITTLPNSTSTVTFNWDTCATGVEYKWIFGSPTISTRKITVPSGTNSVTFTLGQLDEILAGMGINQGQTYSGQWNANAYRQLPTVDSLSAANGPRAVNFTRGIPALTSFNLSSPPSGTTIQTTPTDYTVASPKWTRSGTGVTYKWMFAYPDFSNSSNIKSIFRSGNNGFDTSVNIRVSQLDSLAASLGAGISDSIQGLWRVYAYSANDSAASAQTFSLRLRRLPISSITIGTGTADESYPLNRFYNYYRWQGIYLGSEINTTGQIRKIKFYQNNNVGGVTSENVRVLMKTTTDITLPSGTWDTTGMTVVFEGNINSLSAPGWTEIQLTTPFSINPTQNLMISIGRDFQQYVNTYPRYAYSTSLSYLSRRAQSDTQYPTSLTQSFNRANIQIDISLITGIETNTVSIPSIFSLSQNYPNPFNPSTKISFSIPKQGFVNMKVYDILGKEVMTLVNEIRQAGNYDVNFNGSSLASGVYFYRLESGNFVDIKRMVLVK